jgi:molybdate transport system substrate-binding protein
MMVRIVAGAVCALLAFGHAQAAEIKLLASGAMKEIITELLPEFEKSSGHKVAATWTGTVNIVKQVGSGEVFDLVVVGAPEVEKFIAEGKFARSSRTDLARSGVGLAVKAGAARPDISTPDAVKKALLNAKAVAYSTGPSGVYVRALFDKLGVASEVVPKSKTTAPGSRVGDYLIRGEADLGFQQISELMHEHGIDFLGPLPAEIQNYTVYSSGISSAAKEPDAARALQAVLRAASASAAYKKNGMEQTQ